MLLTGGSLHFLISNQGPGPGPWCWKYESLSKSETFSDSLDICNKGILNVYNFDVLLLQTTRVCFLFLCLYILERFWLKKKRERWREKEREREFEPHGTGLASLEVTELQTLIPHPRNFIFFPRFLSFWA